MTHLWMRAETRPDELRAPLTPEGVGELVAAGFAVTVEDSPQRIFPLSDYGSAGASLAAAGAWPTAPADALILGLKELPADGSPLTHRHAMFGHAYKGQPGARSLLERFRDGGGALLDLEYLTDPGGQRLAAFGHWAGYAGAGVALFAWAAQLRGQQCEAVRHWASREQLLTALRATLDASGRTRPAALVIGARGRVGGGATALLDELGCAVTEWDAEETAIGGPFPEILMHEIFVNAVLARPGTPRFLGPDLPGPSRMLRVIADIACDPGSDFNPVALYDHATSWDAPVLRVAQTPPLDIMAIDNLPALLPRESSADFSAQLLPLLLDLDHDRAGVWARAAAEYDRHQRAEP